MADSKLRTKVAPEEVTQSLPSMTGRGLSRSSSMSSTGSTLAFTEGQELAAKISIATRITEMANIEEEKKSFRIDTALDAFDIGFKVLALGLYLTDKSSNSDHFVILYTFSIAVCASLTLTVLLVRLQSLKAMQFVMKHGYAKHWRVKERVMDSQGGDPRIQRDAKLREEKQWKFRSVQVPSACPRPPVLVRFLPGLGAR